MDLQNEGFSSGNKKFSALQLMVIIAGGYAILAYLHYLVKLFLAEPNFSDFASYYFQGKVINQGLDIYKLSTQAIDGLRLTAAAGIPVPIAGGEACAFYSPVFYVFLKYLSMLGFGAANLIWAVLNNIALLVSAVFLMKLTGEKFNLVNVGAVSALLFLYQPLRENVGIGQSNLLILCALVLALWAIVNSKFALSGFFMAAAILIKPHYALVLFLPAVKKMYKSCFFTVFFYCLLSLLSALVLGWEPQREYLIGFITKTTSMSLGPNMLLWPTNYSFASALVKLFGVNSIGLVRIFCGVLAVGALIFTAAMFGREFKKEVFPLEFAWMLGLTLFLVPILELHYLVLLYVPALIIYSKVGRLTYGEQLAFGAGYILLAARYSLGGYQAFVSGALSTFNNGQLAGLVIFLSLAFSLSRRIGADEHGASVRPK